MNNSYYLIVEAYVRYWEDATINGVEDTQGDMVPCRIDVGKEETIWNPIIELKTGKIKNWTIGKTADIHYKICDSGEYWLADSNEVKLAKYKGYYVPDFLSINDDGYGDYIIMSIDADGMIKDWNPKIDLGDWKTVKTIL